MQMNRLHTLQLSLVQKNSMYSCTLISLKDENANVTVIVEKHP